MAENKATGLPQFKSTEELVDFFDTHDMGEFWDEMPEVSLGASHICKNIIEIQGYFILKSAKICFSP